MFVSRLLREPVLHFLLIGLVLFLYYSHANPRPEDGRRVVVTGEQIDGLISQFRKTWNRSPTPDELTALVETQVRDEIIYREGRAIGLDRDDAVIKRRVRQKYEIMAEEELAQSAATEADLAAYLTTHADEFRQPPLVSFEQVMFTNERLRSGGAGMIHAAQRELQGGADPARFGQSSLLPTRIVKTPLDIVARDFGRDFAAQLSSLKTGEWVGPVNSGFGQHLVRIEAREPAALPTLAAVRDQVAREWENERRRLGLEGNYRRLRAQYDVIIEAPASGVAKP